LLREEKVTVLDNSLNFSLSLYQGSSWLVDILSTYDGFMLNKFLHLWFLLFDCFVFKLFIAKT